MNALGSDAIGMLATAAKEARAHFDALVIGNQGEHFSAGANLMLILLGAQEEEWDELDLIVRQFQGANMALKYADVPVVAAPFGLTLGGGCEVVPPLGPRAGLGGDVHGARGARGRPRSRRGAGPRSWRSARSTAPRAWRGPTPSRSSGARST